MIRYPNIIGKSDSQKLEQMRSYLHQLADELNYQLDRTGNLMSGYPSSVTTETTKGTFKKDDALSNFNDIKALIIKSADIVEAYYEEINKRLDGRYVAESDFGTYVETTQAKLNASSDQIEVILTKQEKIDSDLVNLERTLQSEIEQQAGSIKLEVTDGTAGNKATIKLTVGESVYTGTIDMTGLVTFKNLSAEGETIINGSNIKTGKVSADVLDVISLFAKDINMTGKFECVTKAYLPATFENAEDMLGKLLFPEYYPDLPDIDLNGDGKVDEADCILAQKVADGTVSIADCAGARKSDVTVRIDMSDPDKAVCISGVNMWGTPIETYIGANANKSTFASRERLNRMINFDPSNSDTQRILYRGTTNDNESVTEYLNPPFEDDVVYPTYDTYRGLAVSKKLDSATGRLLWKTRDTEWQSYAALMGAAPIERIAELEEAIELLLSGVTE